MSVSKRLRYEILRRDNHACRYCGGTAPDVALTVDHVMPVALGGSDDPRNLVTACKDCNAGKSASSPDAPIVADVAQDAVRWRRALHAVQREDIETAKESEEIRRSLIDNFYEEWEWHSLRQDHVPATVGDSLVQMMNAGLIPSDIRDACRATQRNTYCKNDFRYFCGVVWNILSKRTERVTERFATEVT